jgi:transposase
MENSLSTSVLEEIFEIEAPWHIYSIKTEHLSKEIDLFVKYEKGSLFTCSECEKVCKVHDGSFRRWRHLDILDYKCYLNIKVPRTKCTEHGVKSINSLPWMRMETHYSLKLEQYIMNDVLEMSMTAIANKLGEPDNNLWRTFHYYITKAVHSQIDLTKLVKVCVDEKSIRRGHKYVTIFSDYDTGNVIFVVEGREKGVFDTFKDWLYLNGGNPRNLSFISMDMSKSYQSGAMQFFPRSEIVFDRFHIKMGINKAVNIVRAKEVSSNAVLIKSKYLWLSNSFNLSNANQEKLKNILLDTSLETVTAYHLKCQFDELWNVPPIAIYPAIEAWIENAYECNLAPINAFAKSVFKNRIGIANSIITKISNGVAEGINSVVQLVKSRARGFRNVQNFINMIYLLGNDFRFST